MKASQKSYTFLKIFRKKKKKKLSNRVHRIDICGWIRWRYIDLGTSKRIKEKVALHKYIGSHYSVTASREKNKYSITVILLVAGSLKQYHLASDRNLALIGLLLLLLSRPQTLGSFSKSRRNLGCRLFDGMVIFNGLDFKCKLP